MKGIVIVALLMAAAPVAAQSIHKCVSASGETSYQSDPCPAGQQVAKSWDASQPHVPPSRQRRIDRDLGAARLAADQRRQQLHGASGGASHRPPSASSVNRQSCQAAKARRDRWLADNPKRTFVQRRSMDDMVYQACKP
ncbi:DUF4124 domain-containing protein [Luteimonas sp. LNNU 24178]|uniref:DUF4124 domain-containing protein n=1 Tax=Luteimonas suaedae TaxID=2605430 RepID=UPI0011EFB83D